MTRESRRAARRRDGPAEHPDAARREGAAVAPAAEAGGPGRAAAVRRGSPRSPLGADAGAVAAAPPESETALPSRYHCSDPGRVGGPTRRLRGQARRRLGHARPRSDGRCRHSPSDPSSAAEPALGLISAARRDRSEALPDALAPRTAIRPCAARRRRGRARRHAGERRLAARGRDGHRATRADSRRRLVAPALLDDGHGGRRAIDPESGHAGAAAAEDGSARPAEPLGSAGAADRGDGPGRRPLVSVARVEPEPPPQPRGGSTKDLSRLGALARVLRPDRRLPAPPEHPQRRDARDRGAAHRHRPARAGDDEGPGRRPVRQARRRDAQADQARPARARDARRDRRDAPADRARLRRLPRPRPAAGGGPRGLRDAPGGRHGRGLPGREPGPDADAAEVAPDDPRRSRRRGRDHPAGPDPGQRRPPVPPPEAGPRAGDLPPPEPRAGPPRLDGRDPLPGAGHADRDRGRRLHARPRATASGGRWARGARAARWRSSTRSSTTAACASRG